MARVKIINMIVLVAFLSGCVSQLSPFVDRRREAGGGKNGVLYVGSSTPENPVVCYNFYTSFEKIQKMADEECIKNKTGTHAVPVERDLFSCRLLTPISYHFKCEK